MNDPERPPTKKRLSSASKSRKRASSKRVVEAPAPEEPTAPEVLEKPPAREREKTWDKTLAKAPPTTKAVKILLCRVGQPPKVKEVLDPWEFTQGLLGDGSLIEIVRLDDGVEAYIDEEGRLKDLPLNCLIPAVGKKIPPGWDFLIKNPNLCAPGVAGHWDLRGDLILTRHRGELPTSLLDEDIEKYTKLLAGVRP